MTLSVDEALQLVAAHAGRQPTQQVPLDEAAGLVLAEPVVADIDSPPFDKSLRDGFAVRAADMKHGRARLRVIGELMAGNVSDRMVVEGTALQIMTGAPMPAGADSVVMVEQSQPLSDGTVELADACFRAEQHVMRRGRELHKGQTVLEPGHLLGPAEIGLLASVGHIRPKVYRRPHVAVLPTGDEIVDASQLPGPGQIRNSNEWMMWALATRTGATVTRLGIGPDDPQALSALLATGLRFDCLLISGGLSMGKLDLVPRVLKELGVEQVFHRTALKPGHPVWFGKHATGIVVGLPGNPGSVLVCFELFVRTALRARQGREDVLPREISARLTHGFSYPTQRLTYHPARLCLTKASGTSSRSAGLAHQICSPCVPPTPCSFVR